MGHLFSRAIRRITQCNQSRNSSTQQQAAEQQHATEQDTSQQQSIPIVHETIPVGQSIDSSEYQALNDTCNNNFPQPQPQPQQQQHQIDRNNNQENCAPTSIAIVNNCMNENNKQQDVEGAVIKIQALVRGHLTRKALKDAHQQSSAPAQNALGQCQFDADSLTRNPPSAVFLPSSPLNFNNYDGNSKATNTKTLSSSDQQQHQPSRTPLESIAEVTESPAQSQDTGSHINEIITTVNRHSSKLSPSAPKLEMPTPSSEFNVRAGLSSPSLRSPALSEANTSIDLDHEAPASASILISDHNIKPSDRIASVLYLKADDSGNDEGKDTRISPPHSEVTTELPSVSVTSKGDNNEATNNLAQQQQQQQPQNMLATDSLDSEEAAAIRIQSAFRGYRTRKNSPYRTRSPSNSIDAAAKRNHVNQQDVDIASVLDERIDYEEQFENEAARAAQAVGRRASRQRHRDLPQETPAADYLDDLQQQRTSGSTRSSSQDEIKRLDDQQIEAQKERIIQGAPSVEEFTTTEDTTTVKEADQRNQWQQQRAGEAGLETELPRYSIDQSAAAALESVKSDEPHYLESHRADGPSLSFNNNAELLSEESNTLDEAGLSAALDASHEVNNTDELAENGVILADSPFTAPRPSEASVELDTDSSVLGAALSLNEDTSLANNDLQMAQVSNLIIGRTNRSQLQTTIDDDRSQVVSLMTDELESEARKLVDELEQDDEYETIEQRQQHQEQQQDTNQQEPNEGGCALASEVEDLTTNNDDAIDMNVSLALELLNEKEQTAIELESDDIERRDPRGQASEERAKSPQIRAGEEEPEFTNSQSTIKDAIVPEERMQDNEEGRGEADEVIVSSESTGAYLGVHQAYDGTSSGKSSATNSSGSESGENSDNEQGSPTTNRQRQQQASENKAQKQQQQDNNQQTGKNKKRNRKRKGKK